MWPFRRNKERLVVDPAMGDPTAARLIVEAGRGDWRAVSEALPNTDDPDQRSFYIDAVGFNAGTGKWIDEWIAAEPSSTTPLLVKGAYLINWAWQARGGGRASTVTEEGWKLFFRRLKLAEDCFDEVTERDPDDATPWANLVILARARQLGLEEGRRRFDEVRKRHPWHLKAHAQMLQLLCAKWDGSHELMHEFAGQTVADMPAGSPLGMLVPNAELEHWLDLPDGADGEYMRSAEVGERVRAAADRSIRHSAYVRPLDWPFAHNTFALAFAFNADWAGAGEQFDLIGDLVTKHPWCYVATPEVAFQRIRKQVYRQLGR